MDKTCKTCRWWDKSRVPDYVADKTDAAPCSSPKLVNIDDRGYEAVSGNGFGLDYPVCDLFTGPDFGCVHWEGKD